MQKLSKIVAGILVLVGIVAIGLALGWFATKNSPPSPPADSGTHADANASNHSNPTPIIPVSNATPVVHHVDVAPAVPTNIEASANSDLITNWEDKIDEILADDSDDTNKVKVLFKMFPRLPEEGQTEVAQHLSNLVEDEDYAPLGRMAGDAKLPEPVLDILLSDLLNRPNSVKLPLLVDIASNPDHAKAAEAKDLLELYLDEDYGNDWEKWKDKAKDWLKDNPD